MLFLAEPPGLRAGRQGQTTWYTTRKITQTSGGSRGGSSLAAFVLGPYLIQFFVDLGPHVLKALLGATGDVDLGPRDSLVLVGYGNDAQEKVHLD